MYVTKNVNPAPPPRPPPNPPPFMGTKTQELKRLPDGTYHKNLVMQKKFSWQIWAIFFHGKSFI
jgi:hypothetical protein